MGEIGDREGPVQGWVFSLRRGFWPCCRPWSRLATTGPGGHQRGSGWNRHDGFGREMYRIVGRRSRGFERKVGLRGACGQLGVLRTRGAPAAAGEDAGHPLGELRPLGEPAAAWGAAHAWGKRVKGYLSATERRNT